MSHKESHLRMFVIGALVVGALMLCCVGATFVGGGSDRAIDNPGVHLVTEDQSCRKPPPGEEGTFMSNEMQEGVTRSLTREYIEQGELSTEGEWHAVSLSDLIKAGWESIAFYYPDDQQTPGAVELHGNVA